MTEKASVPGPRRDLPMPHDRLVPGRRHTSPRQGFPQPLPLGTVNGEHRRAHRVRPHIAEDGA
ncbi:hypothetical protein OHA46_31895 [Streptomyces sp. NBC_00708]